MRSALEVQILDFGRWRLLLKLNLCHRHSRHLSTYCDACLMFRYRPMDGDFIRRRSSARCRGACASLLPNYLLIVLVLKQKIAKATPWIRISRMSAKSTPAILKNVSESVFHWGLHINIKNLEEYIAAGPAGRYSTKWNVTHRRTCREVYTTLQYWTDYFIHPVSVSYCSEYSRKRRTFQTKETTES